VPHEQRQAWARAARAAATYKSRRKRFAEALAALSGRIVTREELYEAFTRIEHRAYNSGYAAGLQRHWRRRLKHTA
jgi:hypothetical protein